MKYVKYTIINIIIILVYIIKKLIWRKKYNFVLPPASAGSLGDEALLSGLYSLLIKSDCSSPLRQVVFPSWNPLCCPGLDKKVIYVSVSDTESKLRFIYLLLSCRHFMVLGADIMDGRYSHLIVEDIVLFCNLAAKIGVPATILGFSFSDTPNPNAVQALKKLDSRITCFCRDAKSLERFQFHTDHAAELVADLAFQMKPALNAASAQQAADWIAVQRENGSRILGFNINRLVTEGTTDPTQAYADELARIMAEHDDVFCIFLPHDLREGQSDYEFLVEVRKRLPKLIQNRTYLPVPPFNAWDIKVLVGLVDLVIAGRMHLTISALAQGVPAIGITYQGKFQGLYSYFDAVELLFDPAGLVRLGALSDHVASVLPNLEMYTKRIKNGLPEVLRLSAKNIHRISFN